MPALAVMGQIVRSDRPGAQRFAVGMVEVRRRHRRGVAVVVEVAVAVGVHAGRTRRIDVLMIGAVRRARIVADVGGAGSVTVPDDDRVGARRGAGGPIVAVTAEHPVTVLAGVTDRIDADSGEADNVAGARNDLVQPRLGAVGPGMVVAAHGAVAVLVGAAIGAPDYDGVHRACRVAVGMQEHVAIGAVRNVEDSPRAESAVGGGQPIERRAAVGRSGEPPRGVIRGEGPGSSRYGSGRMSE